MATNRNLIVALSVVAQLAAFAYGDCSTFDAIRGAGGYSSDLTFTSIAASRRVSAIVECTGSTSSTDHDSHVSCDPGRCALSTPDNFLLNINSTLNITVPLDQERAILSLVKQSVPQLAGSDRYNFNVTQTYALAGVFSLCVPENQTQWVGFTPYTICSTGSLSGCSGDGAPADGTVVTACGIETLSFRSSGGLPISDGVTNGVTTGGSSATPAPANTTDIITNTPAEGATNSASSSYPARDSVWGWISMAMPVLLVIS